MLSQKIISKATMRSLKSFKANSQNFMVLGISGCSCAGKTTLADNLVKVFEDKKGVNVVRINQDDFYKPPELCQINKFTKFKEYDSPESIYFEKFNNVIEKVRSNVKLSDYDDFTLIIIEGSLIFTQPSVLKQCHIRIFFHLSEELATSRRLLRNFPNKEHDQVVKLNIYPKYLEYKKNIVKFIKPMRDFDDKSDNSAIWEIDGSQSSVKSLESVLNIL